MRENEGKLGIFPSKINGRFCFLGFFLNDLLLVYCLVTGKMVEGGKETECWMTPLNIN